MKRVLSLLLAMIMVLSLVACGGNSDNTADGTGKNNAASDSAGNASSDKAEDSTPAGPSRTDVKIPLASVGASMDPHFNTMMVDIHVTEQIYECLYRLNDSGELLPRLAESYEVSADGLEYTYHLREGVKFHNGDPFTAADVVWSFQRCIDNNLKTAEMAGLASVEAVDDYTVKFIMETPNSVFPISICRVAIINKNVVEKLGDAYPVSVALAGTGPYYMESYDQTSKIVLKANPDYYLGQAAIETIEFVPMLDSSTQLIAFESGQFDICPVNAADWEMVSGSGKYNTQQGPSLHTSYVLLNVSKKDSPLYDARVRQAIGYCMNKDDMVAIAQEGFADVANHMVRPEMIPGSVETGNYYTQDIEKAKTLMAEAGYADGFEVVIQALSGANNRYGKIAEVLMENLAEIGITATIEMGESATLLASFKNDKTYDIGVTGVTWAYNYNQFVGYINGVSSAQSQFDLNENIDVSYIQELQTKALAATSLEEQAEYFAEMEDYNIECAGYLPVFYYQNLYAWDKDLNANPPLTRYYIYDWSWN